jgi:hypothetical protein
MNRGQPRTQYQRTYVVIDPDASEEQAVEIFRQNWRDARRTVGGSFDDAGIGDLDDRRALVYGVPIEQEPLYRDWYNVNYPGVIVEFCEVPVVTGQQQIVITSAVPIVEARVRYGAYVQKSGVFQLYVTHNETVRTAGNVPLIVEG